MIYVSDNDTTEEGQNISNLQESDIKGIQKEKEVIEQNIILKGKPKDEHVFRTVMMKLLDLNVLLFCNYFLTFIV